MNDKAKWLGNEPVNHVDGASFGISRREYFAGLAMQGILNGSRGMTDYPALIADNAVNRATAPKFPQFAIVRLLTC